MSAIEFGIEHYHTKDCFVSPEVIKYISNLYFIELLSQVNENRVTYQLAGQYCNFFNFRWKNEPILIKKFYDEEKNKLKTYLKFRIKDSVKYLIENFPSINNCDYALVPLDSATVSSITALLECKIPREKTRIELFFDECIKNLAFSEYNRNHNLLMKTNTEVDNHVEIADTLIRSIFNTFTADQINTDSKYHRDNYGVQRYALANNKTNITWEHINFILNILKKETGTEVFHTCYSYDITSDLSHKYARILSILYRLLIPVEIHPNSLDRLYEKYVLKNKHTIPIINKVRTYSGLLQIEDIIGKDIPSIYLDTLTDDALLFNTEQTTNPDNLIERYLVTRKLFECLTSSKETFEGIH